MNTSVRSTNPPQQHVSNESTNKQWANMPTSTYQSKFSNNRYPSISHGVVAGSSVQRSRPSKLNSAVALSQVTRGKVVSIEPIMENYIQKTMMKVQLSTGNKEERTVIDSGVEAIRIDPNIVAGDTVSLIATGPNSFKWQRIDTTLVDETTTTATNRKKRKVFRIEDLMEKNGIPLLLNTLPKVQWRGPGNEAADVRKMIQIYREWLHHLNPKANFNVSVKRIETFGSTKKLQQFMEYYREGLDPLADDFVDVLAGGPRGDEELGDRDNNISSYMSKDTNRPNQSNDNDENEVFGEHQSSINDHFHSLYDDERAMFESELVDEEDFVIEGYVPSIFEPFEEVSHSSAPVSNPWLKRQKIDDISSVVDVHSVAPVEVATESSDHPPSDQPELQVVSGENEIDTAVEATVTVVEEQEMSPQRHVAATEIDRTNDSSVEDETTSSIVDVATI